MLEIHCSCALIALFTNCNASQQQQVPATSSLPVSPVRETDIDADRKRPSQLLSPRSVRRQHTEQTIRQQIPRLIEENLPAKYRPIAQAHLNTLQFEVVAGCRNDAHLLLIVSHSFIFFHKQHLHILQVEALRRELREARERLAESVTCEGHSPRTTTMAQNNEIARPQTLNPTSNGPVLLRRSFCVTVTFTFCTVTSFVNQCTSTCAQRLRTITSVEHNTRVAT